jgi:hypothetical protein
LKLNKTEITRHIDLLFGTMLLMCLFHCGVSRRMLVRRMAPLSTLCFQYSFAFTSLFFYWLYSPLGPWPLLFSFMIILQTLSVLGRVISSSQGLYLNTGQHKHRMNTYTHQTSMPCVGFEPTIPASERAKTVHALDRSATVTDF